MNENKIYFPGCRIKAACPEASERLAQYMEKRHGLKAAGCCKTDYVKLKQDTAAVLICNNCIGDLEKNVSSLNPEFVLEYIDQDPDFPYPDYKGRSFLLQDCGHGYNEHPMDETVRSLMKKMNAEYVEMLPEERVMHGMSSAEHRDLCAANAEKYDMKDTVCYCGRCRLALLNAGKNSMHIIELLFHTI